MINVCFFQLSDHELSVPGLLLPLCHLYLSDPTREILICLFKHHFASVSVALATDPDPHTRLFFCKSELTPIRLCASYIIFSVMTSFSSATFMIPNQDILIGYIYVIGLPFEYFWLNCV